MRDYQEVIINFVKIVERYPELYDSSHDTYRTRHAELAWDRIADAVRNELCEQCTVEEIKLKWKGIRSSFNRFKNKLKKTNSETAPCKKYYLYDSLKFLEPFTKPKSHSKDALDVGKNITEECENSDDDDSTRDDFASDTMKSWEVTVKPEVEYEDENIVSANDLLDIDFQQINHNNIDTSNAEAMLSGINSVACAKAKKRKSEDIIDTIDSEDLHFFKSILPDIKDFTVKEKRTLKMGILKMIDDIEGKREQRPVHEVTSSKMKRQL